MYFGAFNIVLLELAKLYPGCFIFNISSFSMKKKKVTKAETIASNIEKVLLLNSHDITEERIYITTLFNFL